MADPMDKTEFLWKTIQRYDHYIGTTNAKAAFLIAWNTFLFGTVVVKGKDIASAMAPVNWEVVTVAALLCLAAVAALISLWFTFRVVNPFLKSPATPMGYQSMIFFGHVAQFNKEEYHEHIASMTDDAAIRDLCYQANVLAVGTKGKFARLKCAIAVVLYGQLPALLIVIALWVFMEVLR